MGLKVWQIVPLMIARTKHIVIKYLWFRSKIKSDVIETLRIQTDLQRADIFTKGLTRFAFEEKRKLVMCWLRFLIHVYSIKRKR